MEYFIQENLFREEHYHMLEHSLNRMGLKYTTIKVLPFTDKITKASDFKDGIDIADIEEVTPLNNNDVFVFGSVKMSRLASYKKWSIGSFLNKNHDYLVYREHYQDNLLNYDSIISKLDDIIWDSEYKFIRPTLDTKSFTGAVFNGIEFNELQLSLELNNDILIQTCMPKIIQKEIRFFVVDGLVITGSQYQLGGEFVLDSNIEENAIRFAQSMVDIYQLADAFVIDICLESDEWKIVECGNINCAGFYKSDIQKILNALEEYNDNLLI